MPDLLPTEVLWTISSANSTFSYGSALSNLQLNATAIVYIEGNTNPAYGTFTYSPSSGTILNAGTHVLSVVFTPDDITYATSEASASVTVLPIQSIITWTTPTESITVYTPITSKQLNATANFDGTFIYDPPSGSTFDIEGYKTLSVTFLPTDYINYISASASVELLVIRDYLNDFKNSVSQFPINSDDPRILKNIIYSEYKNTVSLLESMYKSLINTRNYVINALLMFDDTTYELMLDKLTKLNSILKSSLPYLNNNTISVNNIYETDIMVEENLELLKVLPSSLFNTYQNVTNNLIDTSTDIELPIDLSNNMYNTLLNIKEQILNDYIGYYYNVVMYPIMDYNNYLLDNNISYLINKLDGLEKNMSSDVNLLRPRIDMINANSKLLNSIYYKRLYSVNYYNSLDVYNFINFIPESYFVKAYSDYTFSGAVSSGNNTDLRIYLNDSMICYILIKPNDTIYDIINNSVSALNTYFEHDPTSYPYNADTVSTNIIRISALYQGNIYNGVSFRFEIDPNGVSIVNYYGNKLSNGTVSKEEALTSHYISKVHNIMELITSFTG